MAGQAGAQAWFGMGVGGRRQAALCHTVIAGRGMPWGRRAGLRQQFGPRRRAVHLAMPADAQLRPDMDNLGLRAQAASARLAAWARLAVAALLMWALQGTVPMPQLVAWRLALAAVVAWRIGLPAAHRRARPAPAAAQGDGDPQRVARRHWLHLDRLSIAAHGAV